MQYPVLLSSEAIHTRVKELGDEISRRFPRSDQPVLLIGILKGSFIFLADLVREVEVPSQIDFMEVSSYGDGTESSGEIKILKDIRVDVEGRDVVLVEDIVDTGLTLKKVVELLASRRPRSLSVCALLHKPSRERVKVKIDFLGFTIEDHFVVGYGLDVAESYRHLKDIVIFQS